MPILKENREFYGDEWKRISEYIRYTRAKNKCESCGKENHSFGFYDNWGTWHRAELKEPDKFVFGDVDEKGNRLIKVVLTVAHLDHSPQNNDLSNLKALCQKCHNSYDRSHRNETIKKKKLTGQMDLFAI
jgi:hypothetical protein